MGGGEGRSELSRKFICFDGGRLPLLSYQYQIISAQVLSKLRGEEEEVARLEQLLGERTFDQIAVISI